MASIPTNARRVLVTACGGTLGQAVIKALRLSPEPLRVYGCDADAQSIGPAFVDSFAVIPPAGDRQRYVAALDALCVEQQIAAVIPATEVELEVLCRIPSFPKLPGGAVLLSQTPQWIDRFGDKLNCMRALAGKLPLAPFADGADRKEVDQLVATAGFPLMVKGRRQSASRNCRIAQEPEGLSRALAEVPAPVVQRYIDDTDGEFSLGLFRCPSFTSIIALRRRLEEGCTWYAETSQDADVLGYAEQFVAASDLEGAANLQVRKNRDGVFLLEINPRFSSLVAARACAGFRDVEWSLALALGKSPIPPAMPFQRLRFQRFYHEAIDAGDGYRLVPQWLPRIKS